MRLSEAPGDPERAAGFLAGLLDDVYRTLGRLAPTMTDDRCCVVAYETSRVIGELGESLERLRPARLGAGADGGPREHRVGPCLQSAHEIDTTGVLVGLALLTLVLPHLLIATRDASRQSGPGWGPLVRACRRVSSELVEREGALSEALRHARHTENHDAQLAQLQADFSLP